MEKRSNFYSRLPMKKCSSGRHLPNDRISSLPCEVLLIVLSLLPLKEMVKTSILSSRWLNLWVNTPVLDFHVDNTHDLEPGWMVIFGCSDMARKNFVKWVNHVLHQHKGLYLKKFRICCNITVDYQEDVDRWLEFALARKVEILELNFLLSGDTVYCGHNYVLNDCSISSAKANLSRALLQFNLRFLKSLSLKNVNVTGEAISFFLRNCPFLQRLELVGSNRLVNLVISNPTLVLKYLVIKHCPGLQVVSISTFNLVSLDTTVGDLILKDLPMLVELSILGYANSLRRILSQNATCLCQLESLKLRACKMEEVSELLSNLAQLTKLKRLVIDYLARADQTLIVLLSVIESCNHLEEFVLELDWFSPVRSSRTMWKVERHSSLSLKVFEFKGYYGRVSDIELIMHVVRNAPGLEKIIIAPCDLTGRQMNFPDDSAEHEARRFALKHIEDLRESKYIPPHIDVLIR